MDIKDSKTMNLKDLIAESRRKPKDMEIAPDEYKIMAHKLGMKFLPEFPEKSKCMICRTNENMPAILCPIIGSNVEQGVKALPIHLKCLLLWYYPPQPMQGIGYAMLIQKVKV